MRIRDYMLFSVTLLTLSGCTSEEINNLPVEERLPLKLEASFSSGKPVTRAIGNEFEESDVIICYVQHVYGSENNVVQKKLVSFTKGDKSMEATDDVTVKKTSDLSAGETLYWDDFSDSSSEDKDLRTTGHGLRSFYGYCYNGGTPSAALNETTTPTGVLGWATAADQSTAEKMKANDLLWSKTQDAVEYKHAKASREALQIPFTHAMSKFTIVLVAGDGFKAGDFKSTIVTLKNMTKTGTFTAPTGSVSDPTDLTDVTMYSDAADAATATTRTYEAVTVPLTELTKDEILAVIENADGNKYEIKVTEGILGTSVNNWSKGLDASKTQSGYNYKLTITLNKQAVGVVANLANWSDVSATGNGEIQFNTDITTIDKSNTTTLKSGDAFSLWMAKKGESVLTDSDLGSIVTTSSFNGTSFVNSPTIYWPNGSDCYYFRALAKKSADENKTMDAVTEKTVAQGTDLLWGTTAAHKGNTTIDYAEGAAINPRTGEVPLVFKHAMSNVIVKLKTTDNATDPDYVTLTDAKVKLVKLAKSGSIDIANGKVSASSTLADQAFEKTVDTEFKVSELMVPQTLTSDAKLVITVADGTTNGTTYSLKLSDCTLENSTTAISEWESGKQYTYTITLAKEAVKFRVMVQKWDEKEGSGNATLDWD